MDFVMTDKLIFTGWCVTHIAGSTLSWIIALKLDNVAALPSEKETH